MSPTFLSESTGGQLLLSSGKATVIITQPRESPPSIRFVTENPQRGNVEGLLPGAGTGFLSHV